MPCARLLRLLYKSLGDYCTRDFFIDTHGCFGDLRYMGIPRAGGQIVMYGVVIFVVVLEPRITNTMSGGHMSKSSTMKCNDSRVS